MERRQNQFIERGGDEGDVVTCSVGEDLVALGEGMVAAHDVADGEDSSSGTTAAEETAGFCWW